MSSKETIIKIEEGKGGKELNGRSEITILCLDLTANSKLTQFITCCTFVFICYLAYGYFLELIFTEKSVKPVSLYITLIQFILTTAFSYAESIVRIPIERKVPIKTYAFLAALTLGTMAFSNLALSYLNYPTQLIFKSCKLIPVMIGSIIIQGKRYGFFDYTAAIVMCIGLTLFTSGIACKYHQLKEEDFFHPWVGNTVLQRKLLAKFAVVADSKTSPNFDFLGVIIISLALLCDAIIGNLQEKIMKTYYATNNEVVFYSYGLSVIYLFGFTAVTGILQDGFVYCSNNATVMYLNIFLLSLSGYLGLQAVLSLLRICGAPITVTVTTMRKALSIIFSFLFFNKPFVYQYLWSGMLVVFAIYLNMFGKKYPNYVPAPILFCFRQLQRYYQSEYKYLKVKTRTYTDNI